MIILLYYFFMISFSVSSVSFFYFLHLQQKLHNNEYEDEEIESLEKTEEVPKEELKYENKYIQQVRLLANNHRELSSFEYLKNNFIIEKTPVGNVSMNFDFETETFQYYTDNTIPYRFLEVVARKYVITFLCPEVYIDMEKELENIEKRKVELQEKNNIKLEEAIKGNIVSEKKNVFAKFKNYNKEGMSGKVNSAPPPKNSIPSNSNSSYNPLLLKDKANRYVCKGRFSIYPIIKHVDRKKIDKEYTLSFAEFKKRQIEKRE